MTVNAEDFGCPFFAKFQAPTMSAFGEVEITSSSFPSFQLLGSEKYIEISL